SGEDVHLFPPVVTKHFPDGPIRAAPGAHAPGLSKSRTRRFRDSRSRRLPSAKTSSRRTSVPVSEVMEIRISGNPANSQVRRWHRGGISHAVRRADPSRVLESIGKRLAAGKAPRAAPNDYGERPRLG